MFDQWDNFGRTVFLDMCDGTNDAHNSAVIIGVNSAHAGHLAP